jgi:hypothetical protein
VLGRDGLEIATEAAIADQRLIALGELGAQPVEDRGALLGIAAGLGEIATDDVASVADLDLLGLELGELTRSPRYDQRDAFVQRIRSVGGMVELSTSGRDKSTTMFEHVI